MAIKFNWIFSLSIVWVSCCAFVFSSNIPDYIHICHRSDPKVTACIRNSVEALRPHLVKGIPEIGVPGIDPFKLEKIVIFDGVQTPNLEAYLDNVVARGAGKFEITKLKLDIDKMTYRVGLKIPYLEMEGVYKIDARILVTPIKSEGPFHANATGLDGQVLIQGYIAEGNRFKFESIAFKIKIKDFNVNLENLLNNDPVLGQAAKRLMTENKQELVRIATPHIERKCSEIFLKLSNQITDNLDYNEVFPI